MTEATVVANRGIEGDHHGRPGSSRQVVLVEAEVLDDLDLQPGQIREQLCIRGLTVSAGDVIEIGSVRLEVVKPRVPCGVMDDVRPGLRSQLVGRAGWCARAVTGGRIVVGDAVAIGQVDDPPWLHDFRQALAAYEATPRPARQGFDLCHELAHLGDRNDRCVELLSSLTARSTDDTTGTGALERWRSDATTSEMYRVHDTSATAVVEAARRSGAAAEQPIRSLAAHYREHADACA